MEQCLNGGNAMYEICNHLSPIDIISMCRVFPRNWTKLRQSFMNRIKSLIVQYFRKAFGDEEKYQQFIKHMIGCGGIISGSFILQIIYNVEWAGSDIDIFLNGGARTTHPNIFGQFIHPINPPSPTNEHLELNNLLNFFKSFTSSTLKIKAEEDSDYGNMVGIYNICKEYKNMSKIQVIALEHSITPSDYIRNNFDFPILQNSFYFDENGQPQLKIQNMHDVINRSTKYNYESKHTATYNRYIKYKERGIKFDITNSELLDEILKHSINHDIFHMKATLIDAKTGTYKIDDGYNKDKMNFFTKYTNRSFNYVFDPSTNIFSRSTVIQDYNKEYIFSELNLDIRKLFENVNNDKLVLLRVTIYKDRGMLQAGQSIILDLRS
tara:strand:+ start:107415 stop:108554 length:1140 start_codon:yes stop_codon:yes gene_type:complete